MPRKKQHSQTTVNTVLRMFRNKKTQAEICRATGLHKSTVSTMITRNLDKIKIPLVTPNLGSAKEYTRCPECGHMVKMPCRECRY